MCTNHLTIVKCVKQLEPILICLYLLMGICIELLWRLWTKIQESDTCVKRESTRVSYKYLLLFLVFSLGDASLDFLSLLHQSG